MSSIQEFRNFYAHSIVTKYGKTDEEVISAFAAVPRENYVGPGPWKVSTVFFGYIDTVTDDPRILYQDILIGLMTDRFLNNGQPSLHAFCLIACNPQPGECVVHIGAGTGYYTAILAELVGPNGEIAAYEIEPTLADQARRNLSHLSTVDVVAGSACDGMLPRADVIYVNAAATHPLPAWLDALNIGGRLIFPFTPDKAAGYMLQVTRVGENKYAARAVIGAAFTPCIGARTTEMSDILATAIKRQPMTAVKSLHRNNSPNASAWCVGQGWWLSVNEPAD